MIRLSADLSRALQRGDTVVLPTRQRVHAVRLAYAAAQLEAERRVWSTPEVLTPEAWITREVETLATGASVPRMLSAAEDWLLWRQCAAEATREWDLVNRSALAESLRRASALAADFCIDVGRVSAAPGTEPALLHEVQRAVDTRSRALGAAPVASVTRNLLPLEESRRVRAEGFLQIPPRLAMLAGLHRGAGADAHPGEKGLRRPRAVIATDDLAELELIAQWCQERMVRPNVRLLVVLPGSAGARERLATLIRQASDPRGWWDREGGNSLVAIEGGRPLARNGAIAHALSTLKWLGGDQADFEAVSEWLRSSYWRVPDAAARARLDLWLRERGRLQFDLPALAAELRGAAANRAPATGGSLAGASAVVAQIEDASLALGRGPASPRGWAQRFRAVLGVFGWPGEAGRSSDDQQLLMRFHELLDEFGQLAAAAGSVSRETAIQWFGELAARTPFRAADEDPLVTITPMLADPVVRYEGIWVAGLHSDVLPEPVQPDPFLPLATQLAAGIPAASAAGRLQEARRLMRAWRAAASEELVLSAPARSEDLQLLPSPLLAPWVAPRRSRTTVSRGAADAQEQASPVSWLPVHVRRAGLLQALDDRAGAAWDRQRALPGTRTLDLQNTCPFRAYAELRLGSTELGAPEPGVEPRLRGDLLHGALERFWRELGGSVELQALPEQPLLELIDRCVSEAAHEIWGRAQDVRALVRERARTARLIRSLCDLERQRAPFRVSDIELKSSVQLAGTHMSVRIDRIDRLEGGARAVLDYKSGQRPTADWYADRPSHPQLLAYMAAVGEEVVAMATVNVTAREIRFDGIASSADLLPKVKAVIPPEGTAVEGEQAWRLRRLEWMECIERLAEGFIAGNAAVDPKQGACDYCHVKGVCRIGDRAAQEADLIDEDADE